MEQMLIAATAAVDLLKQKNLTVATAESCTGGLISAAITSVSGASSVFECGIVSYSNRIKCEVLGVDERILERCSAVSQETAIAMAVAARRRSGADIGIAVTGNAGPEPSEGKPVGMVFVALSDDRMSRVSELALAGLGREAIREAAVLEAFRLLMQAAAQH